jgi:sulfide:quinone oxidoreductase
VEKHIPKIVVLGTGFGGLEAAFYLRQRLGKSVHITVVSKSDSFLFKPNTIYVPFGKPPERYVIPLRDAFEKREVKFVHAEVKGVEPGEKSVLTSEGTVDYDYLVIATGAALSSREAPGLEEHGQEIWSLDGMVELRGAYDKMAKTAEKGTKQRVLFVVPPKNGCSGPLYEIVLMMDTDLRRKGVRESVELVYTTYEGSFIQAFGPRLHEVVESEFSERGITGRTSAVIENIEAGRAQFTDGSSESFDLLIGVPAYKAALTYDSLPSDERGYLKVDEATRQVEDNEDIYAVGDAGNFPIKQAFLAMLQADAAAEHIAQRVQHERPTAGFDPVSLCIMEQLDKATFAQAPLRLTGDPDLPVAIREEDMDKYVVGTGQVWRVGKKLLGTVLPARFKAGRPFHAGLTWDAIDAGLKVMSGAFAD